MSKLIVCLGYRLEPDNSINPILKNRLKDTADICAKHKNSTLLLMGAFVYKNARKNTKSEAFVMKKYLQENFTQKIKDIKIITEENTTSTVEQICYLKKIIKKNKFKYSDLIIVSSKFFGNRVKLYVEYIFGTKKGVNFVESAIPKNLEIRFKKIETFKLKQIQDWLKDHKKGDDKRILREQKIFQNKILKGKIKQPLS